MAEVDAKFNLMLNKATTVERQRGRSGSFRRSRSRGITTMKSFIGMLLGLLTISESLALRLTTVHIPKYKFRGESAMLECQYELNGRHSHSSSSSSSSGTNSNYNHHNQYNQQRHQYNTRGRIRNDSNGSSRHSYHDDYYNDAEGSEERLYSIKWYKDNEEFYRYVPSASQPIKSYKIDGIRVDPNHSDGARVLLKGLSLKSSGVYRCEISAEAPNFDSVQGEGQMEVIYVPKDRPHINGSEGRTYNIGDTLELNCTSGRSYPASTLQWYLNDHPVTDPGVIVYYPRLVNQHGLITTFLGLSMVVEHSHYINGEIRIKCVASLQPVLWKNGKESVVQWQTPAVDNRVAMLLVKSNSCRWSASVVLLLLSCILPVSFDSWRRRP